MTLKRDSTKIVKTVASHPRRMGIPGPLKIQELLSGAVGTYYQETIRGEWHHRQLLADKEHGLEP